MDKRTLSERDICTKFITPAVKRAGWDEMLQVREEVSFTKGRIIVRGKLVTRGKAKRADYVLYYKPNIPIALIEAKDNNYRPEESQKLFRELSPGFFDLIVIDECHRGSAAEDSAWREILEYFSSATQIGLTATPKETADVSNIDYFGKPIYIYSLRKGIEDGFLAPYKVVRIDLDKDIEGYQPEPGQRDRYGNEI